MLLFLNLVNTCFEVAGIGMLLPIFELLRKGRTADPNSLHGQHWEILRHVAGYFGLSITLGSLLAVTFILILLRQSLSYWTVWYEGVTKRNILNKTRQRAFYRFLLAETAIQDHSDAAEGNQSHDHRDCPSAVYDRRRGSDRGAKEWTRRGGRWP